MGNFETECSYTMGKHRMASHCGDFKQSIRPGEAGVRTDREVDTEQVYLCPENHRCVLVSCCICYVDCFIHAHEDRHWL